MAEVVRAGPVLAPSLAPSPGGQSAETRDLAPLIPGQFVGSPYFATRFDTQPVGYFHLISPTTSSKSIVHFACVQQWLLALQIGSGASKIWLPFGKPTNSGGRKERRKCH